MSDELHRPNPTIGTPDLSVTQLEADVEQVVIKPAGADIVETSEWIVTDTLLNTEHYQ